MLIILLLILIGVIVLGGLSIKLSMDDAKRLESTEATRAGKLSDLESEMARKDAEMKKFMEEHRVFEEKFFKCKSQLDTVERDNTELTARLKQTEKAKEENAQYKSDLKLKESQLQQQSDLIEQLKKEMDIKVQEATRVKAELNRVQEELKTKSDMLEGLRVQYTEMETEFAKLREGLLSSSAQAVPATGSPASFAQPSVSSQEDFSGQKGGEETEEIAPKKTEAAPVPDSSTDKQSRPSVQSKSIAEKSSDVLPAGDDERQVTRKEDTLGSSPFSPRIYSVGENGSTPVPSEKTPQDTDKNRPRSPEPRPSSDPGAEKEILGFPKGDPVKMATKKDIPSDTDFMNARPSAPPEESDDSSALPDGIFRFTNINRPSAAKPQDKESQSQPPSSSSPA